MRRIDLIYKLLGPLAISYVDMASTVFAIKTILGVNVVSVFVEYICIAKVSFSLPTLDSLIPN